MTSLNVLPDELLLHIFYHLNCRAIHECRLVSRRFANLASVFTAKPEFWKRSCLEEISEHVILDLSGKGSIDDLEYYATRSIALNQNHVDNENECVNSSDDSRTKKDNCEDSACEENQCVWKDLYQTWSRTSLLGRDSTREMKHQIEVSRPVCTLRINGEFVVLGSYHGTVEVWDHLTGTPVLSTHANYRGVTHLQLLDEDGFNLPLPPDRAGLRTRLVVTGGMGRNVIVHVMDVTSSYCDVYWKYECGDRILGLSVCGRRVAVCALEALMAGIRVLDARDRSLLYRLYGHQTVPACVTMWTDKVLGYSGKGVHVWNLARQTVYEEVDGVKTLNGSEKKLVQMNKVVDLVARGDGIICLTAAGDLYLSLSGDEFRLLGHETASVTSRERGVTSFRSQMKFQKSPVASLQSPVTQTKVLRMKGNILGMGTTAGTVELYRVDQLSHLPAISLLPPLAHIHTGCEAVRDFDLSDDGDGPMVAIATDEPTITVVRWY